MLSYSRLVGLQDGPDLQQAVEAYRYNRQVFVAPPWNDIYVNDTEHKQPFEEAVATYNRVVLTYASAGYTLIELPRVSVEDRTQLILDSVESSTADIHNIIGGAIGRDALLDP